MIGFLPGLPDVELPPDLVLVLFLPPLLYYAAFSHLPVSYVLMRAPSRCSRSASCWPRWAWSP